MTLYVGNSNDIILQSVRLNSDQSVKITGGSFLGSLCEYTGADISGVSSHATTPTISMSSNLNISNGDEILINRVLGANSANGFFTVANNQPDPVNQFTILADTSSEAYISGGKVWKVLTKEFNFLYYSSRDHYKYVIPASVNLVPEREYLLFIEERNLGVEIEYKEKALVRIN